MSKNCLIFFLLLINSSLLAQKVPVQGELQRATRTWNYGLNEVFNELKSANSSNFWWIYPKSMVSKDLVVFGEVQIDLRSETSLDIIDSLLIGPEFHVESADSDSLGNLYIAGFYTDTLILNNTDTLYAASRQAIILKLGIDLQVEWHFEFDKFPTHITVQPNGMEFYLLADSLLGQNATGVYRYTGQGQLIKSKWYQENNIRKIQVRKSGGLYFSGLCRGTVFDTVLTSHNYFNNLFYGSMDSSLTAEWVKHIPTICLNESTQMSISPSGELLMGNTIFEGFDLEGNAVQVPSGTNRFDFLFMASKANSNLAYFFDSPTSTTGVHFVDFDINDRGMAILIRQFGTDSIDWPNNQKSYSQVSTLPYSDPVLLELDFQGQLQEVNSFPQNEQLSFRSIYYVSDSSILETGDMFSSSLALFGDSIVADYDSAYMDRFSYLRKWSYPAPIGLVESNVKRPDLKIFPNPSSGYFELNRKVNGVILDMSGKRIIELINAQQIDLKAYEKGLYIFQESGGYSYKLIVH